MGLCNHSRLHLLSAASRTNLALEGIASQSSQYGSGYARKAIDGKTDGNFSHGSCTHTSHNNDPWWMITFKNMILVNEVIIANRADCCGK